MDALRDGEDDLWRALAHPTRRQILDLLAETPLRTGDLVSGLNMDRHLVMAHLAVLRAADLVMTEKRGRYRINYLNVVPIAQIHHRWVSPVSGPWAAALIAVRDEAETSARRALSHKNTTNDGKRSG